MGSSLSSSPWKLLFSSAVVRRLQLCSQLCRSLQRSKSVRPGTVTPAGVAPGKESGTPGWISGTELRGSPAHTCIGTLLQRESQGFAWGRLHFSPLVLAPAAPEHGHFGQRCGGLKLEKRAKSPEGLDSTYSSISPTSQMHLECMCSVVKIKCFFRIDELGYWWESLRKFA